MLSRQDRQSWPTRSLASASRRFDGARRAVRVSSPADARRAKACRARRTPLRARALEARPHAPSELADALLCQRVAAVRRGSARGPGFGCGGRSSRESMSRATSSAEGACFQGRTARTLRGRRNRNPDRAPRPISPPRQSGVASRPNACRARRAPLRSCFQAAAAETRTAHRAPPRRRDGPAKSSAPERRSGESSAPERMSRATGPAEGACFRSRTARTLKGRRSRDPDPAPRGGDGVG